MLIRNIQKFTKNYCKNTRTIMGCNCVKSLTTKQDVLYSEEYYNKNKEKYQYSNTKIFIPNIENKLVYVCKIYDGDTFTISTKLFDEDNDDQIYRFSVRVRGVDCPELRTKDEVEKKYALLARSYVCELIERSKNVVYLENITYDKYGRLCADVFLNIDNQNKNLSSLLIDKRFGVRYDGGKKLSSFNWEKYYNFGIMTIDDENNNAINV
jgi:micrococcal nuclease